MTTPPLICIGTHHKTGTHWMRKVFRQIGRRMGIATHHIGRPVALKRVAPDERAILFNWASNFPPALLADPRAQFWHVIRDPRDVLISGMKYHNTTTREFEKFLYIPNPKWDGKSYQEMLHTQPDDMARYKFEMENMHLATLNQMLAWNYENPNSMDVKYEDLITDLDCLLFHQFLGRCGFEGEEADRAAQIYWNNSLFGGMHPDKNLQAKTDKHIQSGRPARWKKEFTRELAETYAAKHGDDLIKLGYETDHTWVNEFR